MKLKNKILITITTFIIIILSLGNFLDISEKTGNKSNLLVSLGGDNGNRIKKTLELYHNGFSTSGKLLLTGVDNFDTNMKIHELDWRANYLEKKGIREEDIIFNSKAKNTLEEILFIKEYMIKNNLKNVIIISDAPHSKRIDFFANTIYKYKENGINLTIVASNNNWWNKNSYYLNPEAIIFSINEIIKFTYYYINYKLGKYNEE